MNDNNGNGHEPLHPLAVAEGFGPATGDAAAGVDAGLAAAEPSCIDETRGIWTVVAPQNGIVHLIDLEARFADRQPTPTRKRGKAVTLTAAAFAGYVARHDTIPHGANGRPEDEPSTELWAQLDHQRVVAIFNPHTEMAPGWGDHRVELQCQLTDAWKAWAKLDGGLVDQEAFAQHVEDHAIDIVRPDGATMLEVAQSLYATTDTEFRSAKRLMDGQTAKVYVESTTAMAGATGQLEVPADFTLRLRPFEGSDVVEVLARLRWRIQQGHLKIGYRLDRPEDVLRKAFDTVVANVEQLTGLTAWHGTAIS